MEQVVPRTQHHWHHADRHARAADAAAQASHWSGPYFCDADHIGLRTVDGFIDYCDFFTIDVADDIGKPPAPDDLEQFAAWCSRFAGTLSIPGIPRAFTITDDTIRSAGKRYLAAIKLAAAIHRHIARRRAAPYVVEVSMDECAEPQSPLDLFFILAGLACEQVPVATIAPKFSGRFNKGVDYVGSVNQFAREFEEDLAVVAHAHAVFGLPEHLKLSVHSGSDKFSLYRPINALMKKWHAGLHLKTAGTTWLEEIAGLAAAGGNGLVIAKDVYAAARDRFDELCMPYASVIDIDPQRLPDPAVVRSWSAEQFVAAVRHEPDNPGFNPHLRQLLHVGYKVAAEMGRRYLDALDAHEDIIARHVTDNLYRKHIIPVFGL